MNAQGRRPRLTAVACADDEWGIGKDGRLLVRMPEDLANFRRLTLGKTVIMGRKTLESLPGGRPLQGRRNLVVTGNPGFQAEGAETFPSPEAVVEALAADGTEEAFVIGGGEIYRAFLPWEDEAVVTRVDGARGAEAFHPDLDADPEWEERETLAEGVSDAGERWRVVEYARK